MKILSISLDKKILDKNSKNFQRQKEYAQLVNEMHIVVFGPWKEIKSDSLFICGSGGRNKIFRFLRAYKKARDILRSENLREWLVTVQDPFFSGFLGYLLKRKFNLKLHVQLHGDFFGSKYFRKESLFNRFRHFLGKFIIKKADGFRIVSQRIKNSLVGSKISEDKVAVVPIYTQIKSQTPTPKSQKHNKFIFLTVGRLVPVKNIELQIKALAGIIKDYPDAELWIIGGGPEKKRLQAISYKLKAKDNVRFWGWQDELEKFYKQADVFLLTSNYEGWGLVVIQAANYSLPIIMTDVGCAREVIKDGQNGIVIPVNNQKALEEAMIKVVEDSELRKKLSENAKKAILGLPSKDETLKLYKQSWQMTLKK